MTVAPVARQAADEVRALREANALLSRFARQAAHDIQEPLRLLAGYLDLLVEHHEHGLPLDAAKMTRDARDTAHRAQGLVASLLDLTRASQDPREATPVRLDDALDDALANLQLRLAETGARIERAPLPRVLGDRAQLARVLQNVLENSLKYARREPPTLTIAAREAPATWVVTLDDNGAGWPKDGRERLFEPFVRLHQDGTPGAGLGLAIVRVAIERMGGRVVASDAPGGGARLELHLPKEA